MERGRPYTSLDSVDVRLRRAEHLLTQHTRQIRGLEVMQMLAVIADRCPWRLMLWSVLRAYHLAHCAQVMSLLQRVRVSVDLAEVRLFLSLPLFEQLACVPIS